MIKKENSQVIENSLFCRGEKARTSDLYVPNVARYQLRYTPPFSFSSAKIRKILLNR